MYGGKVPAANAAMVNCILCRSFDYEPVSPVVEDSMAPGHVSGTTVMTALSLSEATGANGRELLIAMLLGDDLAARLLNTCEFTLALGWDGNGTANALGATAIAGRLLGLNESQLRNAFGLVLSQLSGSAQNITESTTAFKLPLGLAARNAIFSAELALAGWTAPKDALQGKFGYYDLFTSGIRNEELLTKDLGKKFWGDRTFKPYPSCRGTHAPIDCALDIVNNHGIDPDSIEKVTVHLPQGALNGVLAKPWEIGEFPHGDAIFSFRFTVATALLNGSVRPRAFHRAGHPRPEDSASSSTRSSSPTCPRARRVSPSPSARRTVGSTQPRVRSLGETSRAIPCRGTNCWRSSGTTSSSRTSTRRATRRRCSGYWRTWKV